MTDLDRRGFLIRTAGSAAAFTLAPALEARWRFRPGRAPLKVGVIGIGRQGRAILGELAKFEGLDIAAICDVDESRLRAGQRRAQSAETFPALGALLEKRADVRALIVATPTHTHREVAGEALAAGRQVYCEAPLASTIEDARALAQAARRAGGIFQVGLQGRTNPVYGLARSFVVSGVLQETVSLRTTWNNKLSWRFPASTPDREALLNWRLDPERSLGLPGEVVGQQVDTLCWFLNRYPSAVRGAGSVRHHQDGRKLADTVQLEFEFPGGLRCQSEASLASSYEGEYEQLRGSNAAVKLSGTHGWLFKEADSPTQGWEVYANRQRFHNDEGITLIADATKLASQGKLKEGIGLPNQPLYYALESFLAAVTDEKPALVSAEQGYRAAVLGIQAAEAVRRGGVQEIGEALLKVESGS